ncbi:Fic family protein [Arthrobacter sp. ISL-48]|uniref:Fic family protein n=1 Tax=Arthrobacter sp. ISL-48 TaxID=2819110 RepID=UPI001BE57EF4|nr:Fic family protein [Arthrobacter sp. ISL-48]MBT2531343.1 Fic family protein [Arthrobacter sp. ISL-48]
MAKSTLAYTALCPFSHWATCTVDKDALTRVAARIQSVADTDSERGLRWAQDRILRATAFETGAVENLYDEGATYTVAMEHPGWEEELERSGDGAAQHFADQLAAYFQVREWAETPLERPLAEVDIRDLHTIATKSQEIHPVRTQFGTQDHRFISGAYKTELNAVLERDGNIHHYAPPNQVPQEMEELLRTCRSEEFINAHPVLKCAYVHWVIAHIHPFADGNGRVARAFSSMPLLESYGVPFVVYASKKRRYLQALEAADNHHHQEMVDYVAERLESVLSYLAELLESARTAEQADASLTQIQNLLAFQQDRLETREEAANRVHKGLEKLLREEAAERLGAQSIQSEVDQKGYAYRPIFGISGGGSYSQVGTNDIRLRLSVNAVSEHRSDTGVAVGYATKESSNAVVIISGDSTPDLSFRLEDCSPELSMEAELRLRNFAIKFTYAAAHKLQGELQGILKEHGRLPTVISEGEA